MDLRTRLLLMAVLTSASAWAEPEVARPRLSRAVLPNSVGVEALGRTLVFGLTLEHLVHPDFSLGIGAGSSKTQTIGGIATPNSAFMIPVFANYFFERTSSTPFGGLGFNFVSNASTVKGLKSSSGEVVFKSTFLPVATLGYEVRDLNGVLLRVSAYGFYSDAKFQPWLGLTLAYAFGNPKSTQKPSAAPAIKRSK